MVEVALKEFYILSNNGLYNMAIINKWLLKYSILYNELYELHSKMYLFKIEGSIIRLPPLNLNPSIETQFLEFYSELNVLKEFHQKEKYFQLEIGNFEKIKNAVELKKEWLKRNEILGTEEFVCFEIDYLDYAEECYHLQLMNPTKKPESISIERDDFKYTLEFLKTFNNNYYGEKY